MNQKYMIYMYLLKARTFIALLLVIAFFSVMVPNFLTTSNLLIMTQHVAITGLLAIGMTLVILTGGIDLSVGAVAGICGMVAGALLTNGLPIWGGNIIFFNVAEVILCVAIFGVLVGFVNGAVITRFGVAPFICTLGMMYVAGDLPCCLTTVAPTPTLTVWKRWEIPVLLRWVPARCSGFTCQSG